MTGQQGNQIPPGLNLDGINIVGLDDLRFHRAVVQRSPEIGDVHRITDFAIGVVVIICLVLFLGWLMQRGESRAS